VKGALRLARACSRRRIAAGVLVLAGIATLPACRRNWALGSSRDGGGDAESDIPLVGNLDLQKLLGGAVQGPQVVADESVTVAPHAWRGPGFTLPSPRSVHIVADGKDHTEKGFRLYVMTSEELAQFEKRKPFKDVPSFEGLKVHSLDKTDTLAAGTWCVVVFNSENSTRAMVVHLRIVVGAT